MQSKDNSLESFVAAQNEKYPFEPVKNGYIYLTTFRRISVVIEQSHSYEDPYRVEQLNKEGIDVYALDDANILNAIDQLILEELSEAQLVKLRDAISAQLQDP